MLKLENNVGLQGQFQVIVRKADGSIKLDTGMQSNLVLDNGLRHYLGIKLKNNHDVDTNHKNGFMNRCVVGSGNRPPAIQDVTLQNFVKANVSTRELTHGKDEPTESNHPGYVKVWRRQKYIFDGINNENISEVGLASWFGDEWIDSTKYENSYTLMTRALIKGSDGQPLTVTVLEGEILEVIYQVNMYIDIKRQTGSFKLTTTRDGQDVEDTFDYFLQPVDVASGEYIDNYLFFESYYRSTNTWGVKEADSELTADYDLNAEPYTSLTHLERGTFDTAVLGTKWSGSETRNKYSSSYRTTELIEASLDTLRRVERFIHGVYTHIHENGIRAFDFTVGYTNVYSLVRGIVVVKNRANGQGIKKTDRHIWDYIVSYSIKRWES